MSDLIWVFSKKNTIKEEYFQEKDIAINKLNWQENAAHPF